jgi:hypothetical protein
MGVFADTDTVWLVWYLKVTLMTHIGEVLYIRRYNEKYGAMLRSTMAVSQSREKHIMVA